MFEENKKEGMKNTVEDVPKAFTIHFFHYL